MTFQDPLALVLLLPLALLLLRQWRKPADSIPFPVVSRLSGLPKSCRHRAAGLLPWLQGVALVCAVLALSRPQLLRTETTVTSRGVDIVIALDLSTSMLAVDEGVADPDRSRFAIAREVTREFIARRHGDRIGFVAFAARPYPVAPLTLDHDWLAMVLDRLEVGAVEDGTALGDGILAAVNRLRASPEDSRTVVLLTDGRSNVGTAAPRTAAVAAHALGVKIHTIGIGADAPARFPVDDPLGGVVWRTVHADLDEITLGEIAAATGGTYFRANDGAALRSVFKEIDRLEKRPLEERRSRSVEELFPALTLAALLLLLTAVALRAVWLRGGG